MDADNTLEVCESVTSRTLEAVFAELDLQRVLLEGMILKPNMVISGKKCATQADRAAVAAAPVRTLKRHVPGAVPGVGLGLTITRLLTEIMGDRKSTRLNSSH